MIIPTSLKEKIEKYSGILPVPIIAIAKDFGIDVYSTKDLKDRESGVIKKEGDNYVIYINEKHPPTRKLFTIAHEVAHFVQHKTILDGGNEHVDFIDQPLMNGVQAESALRREEKELTEEERKIETEANYLAAEILMPPEEFKKHFKVANSIEEVAEKFGVSPAAATIRAKYLLGEVIF